MRHRWLDLIRDVLIVMLCLFIGGMLVVAAQSRLLEDPRTFLIVAGVLYAASGSFGFFFVGFITLQDRWAHLARVAFSVWIISLYAVFFFGAPVTQWLFVIVYLGFVGLIGGTLATLVRRRKKPAKSDSYAPENSSKRWP